MATPEEIARTHQQQQKGIVLTVLAAILGLWRRLDRDRLTQSWQAGVGPSIVEMVTRAQFQAAVAAPVYLRELALAQDVVMPDLEVVPESLSGIASDGRPLESLLYQPIIAFKRLLADGVPPDEAMRRATAGMAMIAATQVADAGRAAVDVGVTATREWVMYVRVVNLPACGRCIILAGRTYSWSEGFARHPRCDCGTVPFREGDAIPASPGELFEQMTPAEQSRAFTVGGAEAIRLGADLGQVVNARRGMQTAGGRLITSEGTTVRGVAGKKMGDLAKSKGERYRRSRTVRPMPEQILADANGDRDEAIRLLEKFGYLRDPRLNVRAQSATAAVPRPREPEPVEMPEAVMAPRAEVPESARPYHRDLDGIEALAAAVEAGPPIDEGRRLGGSSAETRLLTLADGTRVIRKRAQAGTEDLQDADAEQAAFLVARALGLKAPAVYRNDESSVWMEYLAEAETAEEAGAWGGDLPARFAGAADSQEGKVLGLLDALTHNADRNDGNWMLDGERLVPIDHGMAYGDIVTSDYEPSMEYVNNRFAERYKGDRNPLTQQDVSEVRRRLTVLRPDFDLIGRGVWLDYSLRMLDMLAGRAAGGVNLIGG